MEHNSLMESWLLLSCMVFWMMQNAHEDLFMIKSSISWYFESRKFFLEIQTALPDIPAGSVAASAALFRKQAFSLFFSGNFVSIIKAMMLGIFFADTGRNITNTGFSQYLRIDS